MNKGARGPSKISFLQLPTKRTFDKSTFYFQHPGKTNTQKHNLTKELRCFPTSIQFQHLAKTTHTHTHTHAYTGSANATTHSPTDTSQRALSSCSSQGKGDGLGYQLQLFFRAVVLNLFHSASPEGLLCFGLPTDTAPICLCSDGGQDPVALPVRRQTMGSRDGGDLTSSANNCSSRSSLQSPLQNGWRWPSVGRETDSEATAAQSGSDGGFQGAPPLWLST